MKEETKNCIKELNKLFKKMNWILLPETNDYDDDKFYLGYKNTFIYPIHENSNSLCLHRDNFPYEKHLNKFTVKQLDNYIFEFIIPICKKCKIQGVDFMYLGDDCGNINDNIIQIK